jgi:DNA topoisomerase-1
MKRLIVCEKMLAAKRIAAILSKGKYSSQSVHKTRVFHFKDDGVETFIIGLRGHITALDYPTPFNDWSKVDPLELVSIRPIKKMVAKNIGNALEQTAMDVDEVIIATDYDREGELIGAEALNFVVKVRPEIGIGRARFSALTKPDVERAFETLAEIDYGLVRAAECRQIIDLVWGAALTRFLSLASNQLGRDFLSVGRVQTPTLATIVDREKDIENFVPKPFWNLIAVLNKDSNFEAVHENSPFWENDEARIRYDKAKDAKSGKVLEVEKKIGKERGPIPFNTTIFLAEASKLGISAPRAMSIAESLYTSGYISYPRTDNCAYPSTLNLRTILKKLTKSDLGEIAQKILDIKFRPRNGKATKDHPPIHPVEAASKKKLKGDQWRIYELVVRRFLASLAPDADVEETKVTLSLNDEKFISNGYKTLSAGWKDIYPFYRKRDIELPELSEGETAEVVRINLSEDKTKPPARFSHGSLIQLMEKLGIGTKSTRHEILKKLSDRKYVQGKYLKPTHIGSAVTLALEEYARPITESKMTAVLEEDMSAIIEGKKDLDEVVEESRTMLIEVMTELKAKEKEIGTAVSEALKKHHYVGKCKDCGGDLVVKRSGKGKRFAACSQYPKCETTHPLPQSGIITPMDETCECGTPKIRRRSGRWTETLCINPGCTITERGNVIGKCVECGGNLSVKYSRHGKRFLGCSGFPNCTCTFSLPQKGYIHKTEDVCEVCSCPEIKVVSSGRAWQVCVNKRNHKESKKKVQKKGQKKGKRKPRKKAK